MIIFNVIFVYIWLHFQYFFLAYISVFYITSLNYGHFIASRNLFSRVSFRDTSVVSSVSFSLIKNTTIVYISKSCACWSTNKYSPVSLSIKITHRASANSPYFLSIFLPFFVSQLGFSHKAAVSSNYSKNMLSTLCVEVPSFTCCLLYLEHTQISSLAHKSNSVFNLKFICMSVKWLYKSNLFSTHQEKSY